MKNSESSLAIYLPDAANGYYRGPRFDWSSMVAQAAWKGHKCFGEWKPAAHDPLGPDDTVGISGEFGMGPLTGMPEPPGYCDTAAGDTFMKIGVGDLVRNSADRYSFGENYAVARPYKWTVEGNPDSISFFQSADGTGNYAYTFSRTYRIESGKPGFSVSCRLENCGRTPIRQTYYSHNFIRLDDHPVGSAYSLQFPFAPILIDSQSGHLRTDGPEVALESDIEVGAGLFAVIGGFSETARHNRFEVRCRDAGIGLSVGGTAAPAKIHLFATRLTICPEVFIEIGLEPGAEFEWHDTYRFFEL
jgi:hypothetical protein